MIHIAEYTLFFIGVMLSAGVIKKNNLMDPVFVILNPIKNNEVKLFLVSLIGGILPIPGRVLVSAGILDSLSKEKNPKLGVIDYISTHHYYLWSPLEKTVILPMAALGLSYPQFLGIMWPVILITFVFIAVYLYINTGIISIENFESNGSILEIVPMLLGIVGLMFNPALFFIVGLWYVYRFKPTKDEIIEFINLKLLIVLFIVLIVSMIIKEHNDYFRTLLEAPDLGIWYASGFAFIAAWLMGSSGKYAGLVAILAATFGPQYLMWFLVVEYMAYNLSPTHKCIHIGRMYFETPLIEYFKPIIIWQLFLVFYAFFNTFLL